MRAQSLRLPTRHRAAHAVATRLIACRADHPARPGAAHHHRLAPQLRVAAHLHRGEERVHVDVQDRAPRIVGESGTGRLADAHPGRLTPGYDDRVRVVPATAAVQGRRTISRGIIISAAVAEPWKAMFLATWAGSTVEASSA